MKLKDFFQDILKMPYYKNHSAVSGKVHNIANHEKAVEDLLIKHGFTNANLPNRKGTKSPIAQEDRDRAMVNDRELLGIPKNRYVPQPCGSHSSPDFIINYNDKIYFIECKSAEGRKPTYNSGLPKPEYIYIFCSKKENKTTVYKGDDIVTNKQILIMGEAKKEIDLILKRANAELKKFDVLKRGIDYYDRPMYNQKGKSEITNYFTHENRKACEEKVIKYVS